MRALPPVSLPGHSDGSERRKATTSAGASPRSFVGCLATSASDPLSEIVREAILDYAERVGRLTEAERRRLLGVFDEFVPAIPARPEADVEEELAEFRRARRLGARGLDRQ